MAQHVADVDHRRAFAQQIARERMPEPVGWHALHARPAAGVADDRSHPARLKRPDRRMHRQEHVPLPALTAVMLQMLDDRLADVTRQRELVASVCLAVDGDLPRTPIEIIELQSRDFDRAQPNRASRSSTA